ncbi:site-specific integrase [Bacillus sp. PS06]|uniref:site-specific integrase n=1 Tax=Bacillus sp. PS06 TaxID=2764176 RepID=UPI00177B0CA5|nr:site-specific integrase [Bacillus sp. PS06]MBD8069302.1 site-specific integrase [Bacillus sp. PS06]
MLVGEVLELIQKGTTLSELREKYLYGISRPATTKLLRECGITHKSGGQGKPIWIFEKGSDDLSINIVHKLFFKECTKPNITYEWKVSRDIVTLDEIRDIVLKISNYADNPYPSYNFSNKPISLLKLCLYIKEFLEHPLDGLFVTKDMLKGIINTAASSYVIDIIRSVSFCLALKHKIHIPFNISFNVFKSYYLNSFLTDLDEIKTTKERLSVFGKVLLEHVEDGNDFLDKFEAIYKNENTYRGVLIRGNRLVYYLVGFLLSKTQPSNRWGNYTTNDLNVNQLLFIFENDFMDYRKLETLNCFFYMTYGVENLISSGLVKNLRKDEVTKLFYSFLLYLKIRKLSNSIFSIGAKLIPHKGSITVINDLTKDNILNWITKYYHYAVQNKLVRKNVVSSVACFFSILADIKTNLEDNNLHGLVGNIPISNFDVNTKFRRYYKDINEESGIPNESLLYKVAQELGNNILEENIKNKDQGTFKTEIQYADELVAAVYNYKITSPKGSVEYFNELQRITMLRIMADSGVRSIEVFNTPYGTHSYLKRFDVNICILGWSKFFDRFGIVPISKSTAQMLEECTKIRKGQFPESLVPMSIKNSNKTKGTSSKYVLQFVNIHTKSKRAQRVSDLKLTQQLDDVCKQAGIERRKGSRFHFFRHRAAEFFFFCASYYDFDGKNDYEYKETVVKKLLRHVDTDMTKEYYWGELLELIAKKKLVFYKDFSQMDEFSNDQNLSKEARKEAQQHIESLKKRINKDLTFHLTQPNIDKIIRLFTVPFNYIDDEILEKVSQSNDFSVVLKHLTKIDGNKSPVPPGSAYFGMCLNFSCPKLKEKTTCISCNDHIVEKKDIPRMIGELIRCTTAIQDIYVNYDNSRNDHLESLRARSVSLTNKLKDLGLNGTDIITLMRENIYD